MFTGRSNFPSEKQFEIYIRAYFARLSDAVTDDFPALHHYLGNAIFDTLLERYIRSSPPRTFNLEHYSAAFPAFVQQNSRDAFAHDLAALEGTILEVYWLPDSPALNAETLQRMLESDIASHKFIPRHALRLLALRYPAEHYLADFREHGKATAPAAEPQYVALVRHQHKVQRFLLAPLEYTLLKNLCEYQALAEAIDGLAADSKNMEILATHLQGWLSRWIIAGFFTHSRTCHEQ